MRQTTRSLPFSAIPGPYRPVLAFSALLLLEVLALTLALDTQRLERLPSRWATLIGWSPQALRLVITVVCVGAVLGGRSLLRTWTALAAGGNRPTVRLPSVGLHFTALAVFFWVSSVFFTGSGPAAAAPALWGLAWVASGAVAFLAWSHALLPLARWAEALREHRALFACSAAVGTIVWAFGFVSESFWQPLARQTYAVVAAGLGLIYPHVVSNPGTLELGTSRFRVLISPQCSGYEGVGLIVAFLSVYLFISRRDLRFPAALALLPIGALTVWVLNSARIIALIAIGDAGWRGIAVGGFHSQAGWLVFNAVGLGFVALTHRSAWFTRSHATPNNATSPVLDTTSPYLAPFLTLLAAAMLTGLTSAGFDWLYPARLVATAAVLWAFRGSYRSLSWKTSWFGPLCGVATFALWMALMPADIVGNESWPVALRSADPIAAAAWLIARTVGYVVFVPIAEELAFRGYLTRRFWHPDGDMRSLGVFSVTGLMISSVVFGAFHGRLWLAGTLAGVLFAAAFYRRRSLGDAVLAHATTNGLIAAYVVATGHWSVWS